MKFAIIGLGRFGKRLATRLSAMGHEVIAVDQDRDTIQELMDQVTLPLAIDAANEQALLEHGIDKVDAAIVAIGTDVQDAVLVTAVLKAIGVPRILSRAVNARTADVLKRIGADEVFNPEDEAADAWSQKLITPNILSQHDLDAEHRIVEMSLPESWVGKSLIDLDPRGEHKVNVVAIKRTSQHAADAGHGHAVRMPEPGEPLMSGDVLVLFGRAEDIMRLTMD